MNTMKHVMTKERNEMKTIHQTRVIRGLGRPMLRALFANKSTGSALALLLLAFQTSAATFLFSTGDADGKIATLSGPSSPGKIQTETADDFLIVSNTTLISQAR